MSTLLTEKKNDHSGKGPTRRLRPRSVRLKKSAKGGLIGWWFVIPGGIVVLTFVAYPIVSVTANSFVSWNGLDPVKDWVGLGNYRSLLEDPAFRRALKNTLVWGIGTVPAQIGGGFILAVLLSNAVRLRAMWRTIFVLPAVVSPVVIAGLWRWIYSPEIGVLNSTLSLVSDDLTRSWLGEITWAFPSAMLVSVWRWIGLNMIFYLAALQSVEREILEAGRVDGATPWQLTRRILIPMVKPTTVLLLLLGAVGTFREFETIWVLTGGGPADSTTILSLEVFESGFRLLRVGQASAISVVLLGLSIVTASALIAWMRRSAVSR